MVLLGDTGWDIFSLHYKLTSPVNTVINEAAMVQYQRIFHFLWRLKRVEHALSASWSKDMHLRLIQVRASRTVACVRVLLAVWWTLTCTLCAVGLLAEHHAAHPPVPAPAVRDDPLHLESPQLHDV